MTAAVSLSARPLPAPQIEKSDHDVRSFLIKKVALATLKELAISLSIAAVTCFFIASPTGIAVAIISAVAMVAINALIRSANASCSYKLYKLQGIQTKEAERERKNLQGLQKFLEYLCPFTFGFFASNTGCILVHEGGHAIAAMAVYNHPNPRISISPFEGGVTRYYPQEMSKFGEAIGRENSRMLVAGAGAGLALIFALSNIVVAHKIEKSNPEISRYLKVMAGLTIFQHILYAFSALFASKADLSHDFVALWLGGIHPLLSIVLLILIPLLVKGILYLVDSCRKTPQAVENKTKEIPVIPNAVRV